MARAYLKFKKKGTFEYGGGVSVDVDDPRSMKDIWAAATALMFKEYVVNERNYDNEEWTFELIKVEEVA